MRYLPLEKAILAVVHATRKLPYYFQAHTVVVLTQLPLRSVLRSVDYTGRIALWSTLLGAFDIKYMPRTSVKGQVLADLIVEFTEPPVEAVTEEENMDGKLVGTISTQGASQWKVYVDGATNQKGFGVGLVLISPEMITIEKSLRLGFSRLQTTKPSMRLYYRERPWCRKLGGGEGLRGVIGFQTSCRLSEGQVGS